MSSEVHLRFDPKVLKRLKQLAQRKGLRVAPLIRLLVIERLEQEAN